MVDLAWLLPILGVLNFFLLMAWYIYSSEGSFRSQFEPMNKRILGVFMQDLYDDMMKWSQELKKKIKNEELGEILDSLGDLSKKSERFSSWNDHIERGAQLLEGTFSDLVKVGVFWSGAIGIYALFATQDLSLTLLVVILLGYAGLVFLMRGIKQWQEYCKIKSKIGKKYAALTYGKSRVTSEDEDEED